VNLWRLEVLRLVRTRRWLLPVGVYAFFGVAGPLLARYLEDLVAAFGSGEVTVTGPEPRPVDGIAQFVANASQLGLLAVIVVAAGALAVDAHPEFAAFLRSKVSRPGALLAPRLAVAAGLAAVALWVGTALAWAVTASVLGGLPVAAMVLGTAAGSLYLAFAVAVVAFAATLVRSVVAAVFASLAALIALPILGLVRPVSTWLPSRLLGAVAELVDGTAPVDLVPSVAVTLVATSLLAALAARRLERREL
jgi:ABC-2 type transport system permease protein